MVLIENVVVTLKVDQAIGIIHPIGLGHQVIVEAVGIF
jgi:hypothetical protein